MTYLVLLIFICSEISVCSTGITTRGREFRVSEGQSVELPCYVDDLQDEAAVVWKRGDEILFVDEESAVEDQRFQLHRDHNNFTLIIERVEPYDTATYICSITSPEQSIKHHLQVNVPPSAVISPDSHPLLVNVGENVLIKCIGSGNPTPVVAWSRKDGAMPKNVVTKNGQLRILKITNADSGVYQCSASNDVSSAYESIEVVVQSGSSRTHEPCEFLLFHLYSLRQFLCAVCTVISSLYSLLVFASLEVLKYPVA
ncbi:hypothetical protein AB6A40_009389 [Gnathostoma spinigerum]|uniref:Ig-like domain-containing protein n=1 Tax=Gnathostoma spinigerum TaxID=75299 RepID=A0ABD6F1I2_9BILA